MGRILMGWAELEADLLDCLVKVIGDGKQAIGLLISVRGAKDRLSVVSKQLRPAYDAIGLSADYEIALDALRHCNKIRNQYAHAHWWDDEHGLSFIGWEAAASAGTDKLPMKRVDLGLLQRQAAYFDYTSDWLIYIEYEYDVRSGETDTNKRKKPETVETPPLFNL